MRKTTRLRRVLNSSGTALFCGTADGLSAGLAEEAGFAGLWASGFCISATKKIPDVGLLTMTEHLAASREIDRASSLPVIADVDDGFGDVVNVTRTVREYEAEGIAGICLEDQTHPKRCSFYRGVRRGLLSTDDFCAKVAAAVEARRDPDFVVIARTEALIAGQSLEEALARGRAYARAGADAVLIHSKDESPFSILSFGDAWNLEVPLIAVPTTYPRVSISDLTERGFKIAIFANQGLRARVRAEGEVLRRVVRERSAARVEEEIASLSEIFRLVDLEEVLRLEASLDNPDPDAPILEA